MTAPYYTTRTVSGGQELTVGTLEDAEAAATQWIQKGWHRDAAVRRKRGPGRDLYGPYAGRWTGNAGREWIEVTVRVRGEK
jgi:hypothetical protein